MSTSTEEVVYRCVVLLVVISLIRGLLMLYVVLLHFTIIYYLVIVLTRLSVNLSPLFTLQEVEISAGKSAIVIFVPYRQHKKFQKIQSRLVRELEKKFPGQHVCIIAQRTILSKNYIRENKGTQIRPRSRTLTHVHSAILEDIVYPVQIVGKRTRYRFDGTKLLKIYLDPKDVKEVDYKLKTFGSVYSFITKNNVEFTFPVVEE